MTNAHDGHGDEGREFRYEPAEVSPRPEGAGRERVRRWDEDDKGGGWRADAGRLPAPPEESVEVPHEQLDPETLERVLQSVILREGTDYGAVELSLEAKTARLLKALRSGHAKLWFEPTTQTVTVAAAR